MIFLYSLWGCDIIDSNHIAIEIYYCNHNIDPFKNYRDSDFTTIIQP